MFFIASSRKKHVTSSSTIEQAVSKWCQIIQETLLKSCWFLLISRLSVKTINSDGVVKLAEPFLHVSGQA